MVDLSNVIVYEDGGIYNNIRIPAPFDVAGNLLPPRLTQTQIDAFASPVAGQIVFNTTTQAENYYDGSAWQAIGGGSGGITTLTGDVTAGPGSGSQASTLATVNANVGSFTKASVTVNAKGLVTAASTGTTVLGDLALTSMSTIFGNTSNVGAATTIIQVDATHTSVGINVTPDATGYDLKVNGSVNCGARCDVATTITGTAIAVNAGGSLGANNSSQLIIQNPFASTTGFMFKDPNVVTIMSLDTTNLAVAIGTSAADTKSALDVQSTTKGFLPPRMTNTQRDAISSPPEGLTIYSTSDHALEFYNGSVWKVVATV